MGLIVVPQRGRFGTRQDCSTGRSGSILQRAPCAASERSPTRRRPMSRRYLALAFLLVLLQITFFLEWRNPAVRDPDIPARDNAPQGDGPTSGKDEEEQQAYQW